ncbi:protein-export chaperone SecB [Ostreibacterium oceani]|uniref:Protein-export protein SecB n=1 Tax=Ostreibacterium oceani TaxID=2654998 RepID=A0A6N7F2Y9_9GAMM|nr:protein-export chaperone SecB [Ostreibacterium oceani]MPV86226.1 protein-export chaperone SecB [Ostreibacterium oceani]
MSEERAFEINKIYTKDISSESPNTPAIHQQNWQPEINLNLGNQSTCVSEENGLYEVTLTLTVTAKIEDKVAYVIEVMQAGLFTVKGFDSAQRGHILGAAIPNILFPYARETISALSQKAGFPAMLLNPLDFNALYQQHLQQQAEANKTDASDTAASESTPQADDKPTTH